MNKLISAFVLAMFFLTGCAGRQVQTAPPEDPVQRLKYDFNRRYGYFLNDAERREFEKLSAEPAIRAFMDNFWKVRDTDPNTEQNEFRELIDQRIAEIENEILFTDVDTTGFRFESHGGLRSDMARVYLYYGMPHYKAKLNEGVFHVEMMVWYYLDNQGRPLMRFLFYDRNSTGFYRVFRKQLNYASFGMYDSLQELAKSFHPSDDTLYQLWEEIYRNDPERAFIAAIYEFSYFSDIRLDTAMTAPMSARELAKTMASTVIGGANVSSELTVEYSRWKSFLPAVLTTADNGGKTGFHLSVKYRDIDWTKIPGGHKATLLIRINVQNLDSRKAQEPYYREILYQIPDDKLAADGEMSVGLDQFAEQFNALPPGRYALLIHLKNQLTEKYNSWLLEIERK